MGIRKLGRWMLNRVQFGLSVPLLPGVNFTLGVAAASLPESISFNSESQLSSSSLGKVGPVARFSGAHICFPALRAYSLLLV